MTLDELKQLVAGGESETVEFKTSTGQRTRIAETVCGMLNGVGGFVIIGVNDSGQLIGQQVSPRTIEQLTHELRRIEPPAFPDCETVQLAADIALIVISVSGRRGLYSLDGRTFMRQGPATIRMPADVYRQRLLEQFHSTQRWENEPVPPNVGVADLDIDELNTAVNNAVRTGRMEEPPDRDPLRILTGFELVVDGRLINAAVVLFGSANQLKPLYPQLEVRLARFRGIDRLADFDDNRQYWGNLFSLLRRAESFLLDHVPIAGRVIPGKMQRDDHPLYPVRATREALANAFCHRDYTIPGGAVSVAMYDDRLEIANPGSFHFGITPEKLTQVHESKPWNPIIANVLYRTGLVERWGGGTLNIIKWCSENGNPPAAWSEDANTVLVSFAPPESTQRTTPPEGLVERLVEGLVETQQKILLLIAQTPDISKSSMAREIGVSTTAIDKNIASLKKKGIIERVGPARGGHWELRGGDIK